MKNKNRTGRQKYIPSDRKCKNCVYNGGKRKGKRVCLADTCIYTVGTETVSWVCILGAAPFAALGFVKYNGMTAEKFIWAWIKSEFLMPKKLVFHSTNTYYELMKPTIEQKQKEAYKNND